MKIAWHKLIRGEKGQALPIVLALLLLGGLFTSSLLGYMGTGLKAGQVFEDKMGGLYAADAGVEDALWRIMNDPTLTYPYSPPSLNVNGVSVNVTIEEVTTLYGEEVGEGGVHDYWFELESEFLGYVGDETWGIYNYKLLLTNKKVGEVKVESIALSYSAEIQYLSGLVDDDILGLNGGSSFESFSPDPPDEITAGSNKILTWEFPPGDRPRIDGAGDPDDPGTWVTVTCTFQLEGPPGAPGITAYLVLISSDIGTVWEYKPFRITATAYDGSALVTTVTARTLTTASTVTVTSWQIQQ